jgi:LacI family transcriptional regulator
VFAANDLSAVQTMRTAAELGLRVPADVSVAGFDNIPDSALTMPPLTTVDQSIQALGDAAVHTLLALIDDPGRNDPSDPIHITLPTQLVIRSTTAPPSS